MICDAEAPLQSEAFQAFAFKAKRPLFYDLCIRQHRNELLN